ncbi:hypothetical protein F4810DRAFT_377154 [Camillea tinctor]|nr:hypothetical protein F4810DRAFT_377154 [Camillea tinctor]
MSDQNVIGNGVLEDVEMGGTEQGAVGHSNGLNGHTPNGHSHESNSTTTEQPHNNNTHTSLSFGLKSDPDVNDPSSSPPETTPTKMKSAAKKKGTAAKKGPKRTRAPKMKGGLKRIGGPGANEGSSDDETDNGPYCICRGPDDHRWMISCDVCEDWFHGECVSLEKETGEKLVERFVCPKCTDGKRHYTKYKKMCSLVGCKLPARLYSKNVDDRSVFCSSDHCDAWWSSMIATLPQKAASKKAVEVLTQEDFMGLLAATAEKGGWQLGDKPFGNIEGLWANGLPTRPGVLNDEEQTFLQTSAAERLALGNEIVQYKKMMQLIDRANQRRQAAIEAGKFTKDSCGYDWRLDTVSVRAQFTAWLETAEGQATFKTDKLDAPLDTDGATGEPAVRGMCDKKRCKPHNGWYKLLMSAVRVLIKETATAAASKLEAEEVMRQEAEARYERRQLENNYVEILE